MGKGSSSQVMNKQAHLKQVSDGAHSYMNKEFGVHNLVDINIAARSCEQTNPGGRGYEG